MSIPSIGSINHTFQEQLKQEGDTMSPEEFKKTFQRKFQELHSEHIQPAFQQQLQKELREQAENER